MKNTQIELIEEHYLESSKILFEKKEVDGKNILVLNQKHPFVSNFYLTTFMIKESAKKGEKIDAIVQLELLRNLIDVLLMAYAKAESMYYGKEEILEIMRYEWQGDFNKYLAEVLREGH